MRWSVLAVLVASTAFAADIYRWVDEDGVTHFTDDPSQIPKGKKREKTKGGSISSVGAITVDGDEEDERPDPKQAAPKVEGEAQWRAKFKEARDNIARIEREIAEDEPIIEPAGLRTSGKFTCWSGNYNFITNRFGPDACGLMVEDAEFARRRDRLTSNRTAIKRWRERLRELEFAAANAAIPRAWRE